MNKKFIIIGMALLIVAISIYIKQNKNMEITSPHFFSNGFMPVVDTCDGKDTNPPLKISGTPEKAKSLALILRDPDAPDGTFIHWVMWNIAPDIKDIKSGEVPEGAQEGITTNKKFGYVGPCPPMGETHRYIFTIYALDTVFNFPEGITARQLEEAMVGHILDQDDLMVKFR